MIIPAEITAAISVLKFWPATEVIPLAAYITIFLLVIALANIFPVKFYGHVEYYMSFIKCLAIFVMIFFLFIMTSGGIPATHGPIEFRYWKNPGAFNNGMRGLAKAFVQAGFSFGGERLSLSSLIVLLLILMQGNTLRSLRAKPSTLDARSRKQSTQSSGACSHFL